MATPDQRRPGRTNDVEIARRIEYCVERLSTGVPRRMILAECSDKFGVSSAQADRYMAEARQVLVAQFRETREEFVANQMAALEHLAHIAAEGKQFSAAAGARATMARMIGVDAPRTNNGSK
jgi:hypothetical protein